MSIYIVRWPGLSASLVRAYDEDELIMTLDQKGNADGCQWSLYEGPIFLNFDLPVEWDVEWGAAQDPITPDQVTIGDVQALATEALEGILQISIAGDDGFELAHEILGEAFPVLFEAHENAPGGMGLGEPELRQTLHAELERLIGYSWRQAHLQGKTDPATELALAMDLPVSLAKQFLAQVEQNVAPTTEPAFMLVEDVYRGQFVNEMGDSSTFCFNYDTQEATLTVEAVDGVTVHPVVAGAVPEVSLSAAESMWLKACWMATGQA